MKRYVILFFCVVIIVISCSDDESNRQYFEIIIDGHSWSGEKMVLDNYQYYDGGTFKYFPIAVAESKYLKDSVDLYAIALPIDPDNITTMDSFYVDSRLHVPADRLGYFFHYRRHDSNFAQYTRRRSVSGVCHIHKYILNDASTFRSVKGDFKVKLTDSSIAVGEFDLSIK